VLIRCERCQALYSLQDGVVKGATTQGGTFSVECGRCELVFAAKIPQGRAPSVPISRSLKVQTFGPRETPSKGSAAAEQPAVAQPTGEELAKALRPKRPVPVSDPDSFEKLLAQKARTRRNVVLVVLAAALLGAVALALPSLKKKLGGMPKAAQEKLERARQVALLDDLKSLEQAVTLFSEAAKLAPGEAGPEGERALALLLLAGAHKDQADRLEAAARERNDKLAKLQIEKPEGWQAQADALTEQVKAIAAEREPHTQVATKKISEGLAAARAALAEDDLEPSGHRAMALYQALGDAGEKGLKSLERAAQLRPAEALDAWVRAQLFLCGAPSREKEEKGLEQLALALQAEPGLLRALYDQASIEVERQQYAAARKKLTSLLAGNPLHERAKRLLASLPAAQ
jgi:hypothetical protein